MYRPQQKQSKRRQARSHAAASAPGGAQTELASRPVAQPATQQLAARQERRFAPAEHRQQHSSGLSDEQAGPQLLSRSLLDPAASSAEPVSPGASQHTSAEDDAGSPAGSPVRGLDALLGRRAEAHDREGAALRIQRWYRVRQAERQVGSLRTGVKQQG